MFFFFVNYDQTNNEYKGEKSNEFYYTLIMADFIKEGGVSSNLQQK
jgi:hypothetical protein